MSIVNLNCFEKTKVRWGIFKKLSPTNLHSERSDPLAANVRGLCVRAELETQKLNMETQFNNSTNVEDSTSARLTQNRC